MINVVNLYINDIAPNKEEPLSKSSDKKIIK
jgi:hypothetical protein